MTDRSDSPDLLFGKIAVRAGYLTEEKLAALTKEMAASGAALSLGEFCLMRGTLTTEQVQRVHLAQQYMQMRTEDGLLGTLIVKSGIAERDEVQQALDQQARRYRSKGELKRLGDLLVEAGVVKPHQIETLQSAQGRWSA